MLAMAHIEVMPLGSLEDQLQHLAAGSTITVTCSPKRGIDATVRVAALLSERGLDAVPHIAARQVRDENHLKRILDTLSEAGIQSIFVPGGDVSSPEGEFDSALQLLQAMSNCDHGVTEIGVAVYPEGHPFIDNETLTDALRAKQEFATNCVTQLCFSGDTITNWIDSVRDQGISLPVRVGLPGAVERKKLFAFSLRIGVGESARFLMKQPKMIGKLLAAKTYQPDDLVSHLANFVDNPRFNIAGLHLYTFNQVAATNRWRESFVRALYEKEATN
jgi:methylenetetrahydrofolate reductase (NADPH)